MVNLTSGKGLSAIRGWPLSGKVWTVMKVILVPLAFIFGLIYPPKIIEMSQPVTSFWSFATEVAIIGLAFCFSPALVFYIFRKYKGNQQITIPPILQSNPFVFFKNPLCSLHSFGLFGVAFGAGLLTASLGMWYSAALRAGGLILCSGALLFGIWICLRIFKPHVSRLPVGKNMSQTKQNPDWQNFQKTPMFSFCLFFVAVISMLSSLVGGCFVLNLVVRQIRTANWVRTSGTIIHSKNVIGEFSNEYSYEVKGKKFTSDRIAYAALVGQADELLADTNKTPKDREIIVYYNPANPADSVLKAGFFQDVWIYLIFVLFLFLSPFMVLLILWKKFHWFASPSILPQIPEELRESPKTGQQNKV